ncbi:MAG: hypothetical protein FWD25_13545, partial [Clostridia bacterium]|nr:hypothetical protein [Clostridia bacterium]
MKRVLIILFIASLTLLASCTNKLPTINHNENNKTTNTKSSVFDSKSEKIEFLKKYLLTYSEIADAEYHIVFYDNSTGLIPGPSDWDLKVAIKISPTEIDGWLEDMEICPQEQINMA